MFNVVVMKTETNVKKHKNPYIYTKFDGFDEQNNAKNDLTIKWSIKPYNDAEPPQSNSSDIKGH